MGQKALGGRTVWEPPVMAEPVMWPSRNQLQRVPGASCVAMLHVRVSCTRQTHAPHAGNVSLCNLMSTANDSAVAVSTRVSSRCERLWGNSKSAVACTFASGS